MRRIGRLWWRFRKSSHNNVMANFSIYFHMQKPTATFLKCLFFLFALDGHRGLVHPIPSRTRIRLRSWPTRELSKPPFPVVLCSAREPGKAVHLYFKFSKSFLECICTSFSLDKCPFSNPFSASSGNTSNSKLAPEYSKIWGSATKIGEKTR